MIQSTQTVISTAAASAPTWWDKAAAASTVAVAIFAGVEIWRAGRQRQAEEARNAQERADRQAAADARISSHAYALRRQLLSWVKAPNVTKWVEWARAVKPGLGNAEARLHLMLAEVDASPPVKEALRNALLHFHHAVDTLDRTRTEGEMDLEEAVVVGALMPRPEREFQECAADLTGAIDPALDAADKEWAEWWAENSPWALYPKRRAEREAKGDT